MNHELTPAEKRMIERELIAREAAAARRRALFRTVFAIGITAGVAGALLRGLAGRGEAQAVLRIAWMLCIVVYTGGLTLPLTLARDFDMRWHFNPWEEALQHLTSGARQFEAIALLLRSAAGSDRGIVHSFQLPVTTEPNPPRGSTRTAPLWRIVACWGLVALLGVGVLCGLIEGDVVWGKGTKVHYTRSHDPAVYWLTIAWQSFGFVGLIYSLLKTKPEVSEPPKRDLTPRDGMGNGIDGK